MIAGRQLTGCRSDVGVGQRLSAEITELHLFADDDETGRKAAEITFRRHRALGRTVIIHLPPSGCHDWGDLASVAAMEMAT